MPKFNAQRHIGLNHDRELNQARSTRRVEWLAVLVLVGLFAAGFGFFALRFVRTAWATSYQSSARAARLSVQVAVELCRNELKLTSTGQLNYHLGVTAAEDDENGALIRAALAKHLPVNAGAGFGRTTSQLEQAASGQLDSVPLVFSATQQNGVFILFYWRGESAWLKNPAAPDCSWLARGDVGANLAGLSGSFVELAPGDDP